jgi:hypothetical protein
MAREPAFGAAGRKFGRLKRVGRCIISPLGICPSVRVRESLGILFDERNRFQGVRHRHEIGGGSVFLKDRSIFVILEASGKSLPLPGTPSLYAFIITSFAAITISKRSDSHSGTL